MFQDTKIDLSLQPYRLKCEEAGMTMSNVDQRLQDLLVRTRASLVKPEQLLKEAKNVPMSVALAFTTQRPGLIRAAAPTALTAEQVSDLYDFIATLIETNHALQQHAHQVAQLVSTWMDAHKGMANATVRIKAFANFEDVIEEDNDRDA